MAEMPSQTAERVHLQWNEGWHTWQEVLPQYARKRGFVTFIRADLVDDLVKALEGARERLEVWSDIASDATHFRQDISDDLAKIDAALTRIKETT